MNIFDKSIHFLASHHYQRTFVRVGFNSCFLVKRNWFLLFKTEIKLSHYSSPDWCFFLHFWGWWTSIAIAVPNSIDLYLAWGLEVLWRFLEGREESKFVRFRIPCLTVSLKGSALDLTAQGWPESYCLRIFFLQMYIFLSKLHLKRLVFFIPERNSETSTFCNCLRFANLDWILFQFPF